MHRLQQLAFEEEGRRCATRDIPPLTEPAAAIAGHIKEHLALVAERTGVVVGCIRGIIENGVCTIRDLVVDPARQGQGIGSRLLLALESSLTPVDRINLTTNTLMQGNERFYSRHGHTAT